MKIFLKPVLWALLMVGLWSCNNKPTTVASESESATGELSATGQDPQKVSFSLSLQNAKPDQYLYISEYNGATQVVLDSFMVDDAGSFEKTYEIPYPAFYTLKLYNNQGVNFIMNDSPVNLSVDAGNPTEAKIEGGVDNELNQEFQVINEELIEESQELRAQGSTLQSPKEQKAFQETYMAFVERAKKRIFEFVEKGDGSIVSLQAMNMLSADEDFKVMQEVSDKLYAKYPNAPIVKKFHEQIVNLSRLAVGQEAPDFALKTAGGEEIKLSSLRGEYVMIDFWASWCGPCRKENPQVKEVYTDFKDKGFQILAVSVDQDRDAWQKAIKTDGLPWLHVLDEKKEVGQTYNVTGIPFTVLLDKEGVIIAKGLRSEALREKLGELL